MLVVQSETLFASKDEVMQRVYAFLGLAPFHPSDRPVHKARNYCNLPESLRTDLQAEFAVANERLYADPLVTFRW